MQVLIRLPGRALKNASIDVAGRPLLVRQLQWLRDVGVERIVVGIDERVPVLRVRAALRIDVALAAAVAWVADDGEDDPRAVVDRAGVCNGGPLVVLPSDVLGGADLARIVAGGDRSRRILLRALERRVAWPVGSRGGAAVDVLHDDRAPLVERWDGGWGVRIRTAADGLAFGLAALEGALPPPVGENASTIPIHAAQREPGVWFARGAHAEHGARLVAPVLLGPDALVCAGATVGPGSVLLRGSVVERGAVVARSLVGEHVILGEGVTLTGQHAEGKELVDLETGARSPQRDPLVLDFRPRRSFQSLPASVSTSDAKARS